MKSKGKQKRWKPVGGCVVCVRVCVIKEGNGEGREAAMCHWGKQSSSLVNNSGLKFIFNRYLQKTEGVVIWANVAAKVKFQPVPETCTDRFEYQWFSSTAAVLMYCPDAPSRFWYNIKSSIKCYFLSSLSTLWQLWALTIASVCKNIIFHSTLEIGTF